MLHSSPLPNYFFVLNFSYDRARIYEKFFAPEKLNNENVICTN